MPREWMPWDSEDGNEAAIARREMFLPTHLQMHGNMRALRDAYLAVFILSMPKPPPQDVESHGQLLIEWECNRHNMKARMQKRIKFLTERMSEETVEQCKAAAREMGHGYTQSQIRKQADRYQSPKKHTARMSPEEYRATIKRRKVRERKEWEM